MHIGETLRKNTAVAVVRLCSDLECSDGEILEIPLSFSDENHSESFSYKDSEWEISLDVEEVNDFSDIYDVSIGLRLKKGEIQNICISLVLKFHSFSEKNFLFIPSAFYGKVGQCTCYYCQNRGTVSYNSLTGQKGKLIGAGQCPTPCVGFFNQVKETGFLLCFNQDNLMGYEGIGFNRYEDKKLCEFLISLPIKNPTDDITDEVQFDNYNKLVKGEVLKIDSKIVFSPCKDLGAFYNTYFDIIAENYKETKLLGQKSLSYSSERLYESFNSKDDFEAGVLHRSVATLYNILFGDHTAMGKAAEELDYLLKNINLEGISLQDDNLETGDIRSYKIEEIEASYFITKALLYLSKKDDRLIKEKWNDDAGRLTEGLIKLIDREALPYLREKAATTCPTKSFCMSVPILPAALTYISIYIDDTTLLSKAQELSDELFNISFDSERYFECLSESRWAYMLLESIVAMYEATDDKKWLEKAKATSSLLATWHAKYDLNYYDNSKEAYVKYSAGTIIKSINERHKSSYFENYSGNALFRLFLHTEDIRYLNLLKQTLRCWTDNFEHDSFTGLLSYVESPGLYINSVEGFVASIDVIDAKVLDRRDGKLRVVVTNPTSYEAKVRTMVNSSIESKRFDKYYIPEYKVISFSPGETKVLAF